MDQQVQHFLDELDRAWVREVFKGPLGLGLPTKDTEFIRWRSLKNRALEALQQLGYDTRKVDQYAHDRGVSVQRVHMEIMEWHEQGRVRYGHLKTPVPSFTQNPRAPFKKPRNPNRPRRKR